MGAAVAVTGGLGFIGTHLCRALAERGYYVRCIDRLSGSYAAGNGPGARTSLQSLGNVSVVLADVGREPIEPLLDGTEAVIHLAGLPGVRAGHDLPRLWRENVLSSARLAGEAARGGRRLVLASTSSVYGDSHRLPSTEAAPPLPLNAYAVSKLAAEQACLAVARERHGDVVTARLFTVFGPGQRPDMAFARWIDAMLGDRPVEWCAHPSTARDFTYVGDAVTGLIATLERGRAGEIYNVAGPGPAPLRHALEVLERLLDRRARVRGARSPAAEARVTAGCCRKAARELGYRPATSLEHGLELQVMAALACSDAAPGDRAARAARSLPAPVMAGR